jgi:hypothetical protein
LVAAAIAVCAGVASPASATHNAAKPIHPGVMTFTQGAQCTSNFVFRDGGGTYIGQAAHCSGTGGATETNGCDSGSLPIGTQVEVDGATQPGTLVYNSWLTMQSVGETNEDACQYNDFALVRIDPADVGRVDSSVPGFGGPTSVGPSSAMLGDTVYSYGNSSLRGGVEQLSPKEGVSLGQTGGGWSHSVFTASPGIPGDSGSAFIDKQGRAFGVLATLQIAPLAGSNGVGDVSREIAYMHSHGGPQAQLALGTEAFRGPLLPVP